jgi:hypothetical protein
MIKHTLLELMRRSKFPRPAKISVLSVWDIEEIAQSQQARIEICQCPHLTRVPLLAPVQLQHPIGPRHGAQQHNNIITSAHYHGNELLQVFAYVVDRILVPALEVA